MPKEIIRGWESRAQNLRAFFQVSIVILTFLILFAYNFPDFYNKAKDAFNLLVTLYALSVIISAATFTSISDYLFGKFPEYLLEILGVISNTLFITSTLTLLFFFPLGNGPIIYLVTMSTGIFILAFLFFYKRYSITFKIKKKE